VIRTPADAGAHPRRARPRGPRSEHDKENVMRRKGTIAVIDLDQCAIAIATAAGEYTVVEIDPDWRIDVGDAIEWENGEDLGFQSYENVGKGSSGDVFVQNHYVSEKAMRLQFPG
jgi:hypothetical protein